MKTATSYKINNGKVNFFCKDGNLLTGKFEWKSQTLDLRYTKVIDISALSGLTNLKTLDLSYTKVIDISALSGLTNLKTLDLRYTEVIDISALSGLTNLKTLDLSYTEVIDISALSGLTNLKTLDLRYTEVIAGLYGKILYAYNICFFVERKRGGVYYGNILGRKENSYVVEKDGVYSHGKTLKEAKKSFLYKISIRDVSEYKSLTTESVLSLKDMIECYRVITGACDGGVRHFCESNGKLKKEYSIKEVIKLTDRNYGNSDFIKFFTKGEKQ
ncbi:MAG: leucine-rich repeat domain-containing protein [Chitinivibrionia bacterium]|nr:leucine-rich repeat domain-containing protein [Chitinivibrionia bacterium]